MRLADGKTPLVGRVEVCKGGAWGTICDEYWDTNDATVVCRQLGYSVQGVVCYILYNSNSSVGSIAGRGSYTEGTKRTHISDLHCAGTESNIWDCSHNVISNDCGTDEDAYVQCQG